MCIYIYINTPICFFFSESNFWPWRWEFTGNTQACSQHPEYNGKMAILTANFCPENSPRWFSHLSRSWNKPVPGPKPCNLSPEEDLWDQMIEDRRNPRPPRVLNEISSKLTKNIPSVRVDLPTNQISPYVYIYIYISDPFNINPLCYIYIYICLSVTNLKDTICIYIRSDDTISLNISIYEYVYIYIYIYIHVYGEQTIFTHKTHGPLPVPPLDKHPLCPLSAQVARSKVQQLYNELHKPTSTVGCYSPAVTQWNSGEFHGIFVLDFIGCYYVMMLRSTKKKTWDCEIMSSLLKMSNHNWSVVEPSEK